MALHRDIHWIGRQWAVTGYGMQAVDQKRGGQFDIEIARLWDDGLLESLSEQIWFNPDDFSKGLTIARKRFPAPPRAIEPEPAPEPEAAPEPEPAPVPPPLPVAPPLQATNSIEPPPEIAEVLEPKTPATEPVEQAPPAPPEDLLKKWFEAYGLNKAPPSAPASEPQHDAFPPEPVAKPPAQTEPIVTVEQPAPELPATKSTDPPASSILQMPIPGRARFVRLWRVQIHAVQSYRL